MSFPFYIARRYLLSKKSTNAINLISAISVAGVAVATAAMVIVLSVFNGFHDLVAGLLTNFDPELKVVPAEGKTVAADDPLLDEMRRLPQVAVASDCVEDMALAFYNGKQSMVTVKGVDDNFTQLTDIGDILIGDGGFLLHDGLLQYGVIGIRLAQTLGTGARWQGWMQLYAPMREGQLSDVTGPEAAFVCDSLLSPGVVFVVNQARYDRSHILTSVGFARSLFSQQGMVSAVEFRLADGADTRQVKKAMRKIGGERFRVLDRYEQQSDTFRIMQIEKLLAYFFLTFILVVACFNMIGSLSMLMIDKRADIITLRNMGVSGRQTTSVFLLEGRMIAVMGAVVGIAVGLLLCWLQQQFGIVRMGSSAGVFIVEAYPVTVRATDIAVVFLTVIVMGWAATWWPVRYMSRRILNDNQQ